MTKHTPGPWAVHSDRLSIHRPAMPEDEGHEIRRLVALVYSNCQAGDSNLDANARLIAAAPDLLEALKEINGIVEHAQQIVGATLPSDGMSEKDAIAELLLLLDGQDQRRIQGAARAAIAKAEDAP